MGRVKQVRYGPVEAQPHNKTKWDLFKRIDSSGLHLGRFINPEGLAQHSRDPGAVQIRPITINLIV